jgi:NAD+ kinase
MRAGIVSRTDIPSAVTVTRRIMDNLASNGVEVCVETETALAMKLKGDNSSLSEIECEFMVTVGGDGTILRAAMEMGNPGTPILGVNMGRRGFLSEVLVPEVDWALDKVLKGDYILEESMKVSSRCLDPEDKFPDGLNELLVAPPLRSKMILLGLYVDGEHIVDLQADGAIVATPAGSTAYNMSAGGSIVSPKLDSLLLTAICPYSYFKSLVVPPESVITIELLKPRSEAMAIVDGRAFIPLKPTSTIECRVSPNRSSFIRFRSFYNRIQRRIMTLRTT